MEQTESDSAGDFPGETVFNKVESEELRFVTHK